LGALNERGIAIEGDRSDLPVGLFCSLPVNPHLQKYFCFSETQISLYLMPSCPEEGRWPSSRTLGRDAVDAAAQGAQGDRRAG
jgi:hypothetical protein